MSDKTDILKGRIEEAVGVLTGNDEPRQKDRTDQAWGEIKKMAAGAGQGYEVGSGIWPSQLPAIFKGLETSHVR